MSFHRNRSSTHAILHTSIKVNILKTNSREKKAQLKPIDRQVLRVRSIIESKLTSFGFESRSLVFWELWIRTRFHDMTHRVRVQTDITLALLQRRVRIVQFEHQTCFTQAALVRCSVTCVDLAHCTRVILIRNSRLGIPNKQKIFDSVLHPWARERFPKYPHLLK